MSGNPNPRLTARGAWLPILAAFAALGTLRGEDTTANGDSSQPEPAELVQLRDSFRKKIGSELSPLRESLLKRVKDLEESLSTAGRLEETLAVREFRLGLQLEGDQTARGEVPAPDGPKELVGLVKTFSSQREKALVPLEKIYTDALRKLEKRLVKAGRLNDALAVQQTWQAEVYPEFRLVIWNTHNGNARDRGSLKANVVLSRGGEQIWSKSGIALGFDKSENKQTAVSFRTESLGGCRLKIEITEWYQLGGGLNEIQVFGRRWHGEPRRERRGESLSRVEFEVPRQGGDRRACQG